MNIYIKRFFIIINLSKEDPCEMYIMNMLTELKNLINEHTYLKDLCKEQAKKIEQLENLLNESRKDSLFETTARTKESSDHRPVVAVFEMP